MKKTLIFFLLTAMMALCACTQPAAGSTPTVAIPPSIQTSKTPLELLTAAMDNTKNVGTFTVQYGTVTTAGEDTIENLHTQQVSPEHPFDWNALYTALPNFPTNEHLLSDFCSGALRAIPSNTGSIRYERPDLTHAEMELLMYAQSSKSEDHVEQIGTIAIEVDENNRFTQLELLLEHYGLDDTLQRTVTIVLSVTFPT